MLNLRSVASALASIALLAQTSQAYSTKRDPLPSISALTDAVIDTPSHRIHSHSQFGLTFNLNGGRQMVRLALHPNLDLLHDDFSISRLNEDGTIREIEKVDRTAHRVYRGDALIQRHPSLGWSRAGWARIMLHEDGDEPVFDGAFAIDGDTHHVQTATNYLRFKDDHDPPLPPTSDESRLMVVWRDSDLDLDISHQPGELRRRSSVDAAVCEADTLDFNTRFPTQPSEPRSLGTLHFRSLLTRQAIDGGANVSSGLNLISSIGSTNGCPSTRKVAPVGIAADCNYRQGFQTEKDLQKHVLGIVNQASLVYENAFKISLSVKNITVPSQNCPPTAFTEIPWNVECNKTQPLISDRLSSFSKWRGKIQDTNAFWTLLTSCNFGSAVGLAWRGQLCRTGSPDASAADGSNATVTSANVVVGTTADWQVYAHEAGHIFGAVHDCTSTTCPVDPLRQSCCPLSASTCDAGGRYIMNPSADPDIKLFSPCSIGNICSGLQLAVKASCLTDNKDVQTFTGSQCGNGIVEVGEDCDCGGDTRCKDNPCCDPATCKFAAVAVCDPTNEICCTKQCRFAANGTVCRPSAGPCDLDELCPGDRATCPPDAHKNNGDPCGGDGFTCASGQCTSRDQQCRAMITSLYGVNDTTACRSSGCVLACTAPGSGPEECLVSTQDFLDGTPCGGGGLCANGNCEGASTLKEVGQWIQDHKAIFIPVVCVVGGLVLLALLSCLLKGFARRACARRAGGLPKQGPVTSSRPSVFQQQQQRQAGMGQPVPVPGPWQDRQRSTRWA